MDDFDHLLSLRPDKPVGTGSGLPSRATLQALAVMLVLVVAAVAGFVWSNGKVSSAATTKQNAEASKEQVELQAKRLQDELKRLEGAGGSQRIDTIRQIIDARTDWRAIILAIGRSAPNGLELGGFSGSGGGAAAAGGASASAGGAATPGASTGTSLSLAGSAPSIDDVQQFIRALRRRSSVIEEVQLQSASRTEDSTTFTLKVDLKTPAPLPTATPGAAPSGDAEATAPSGPQGELLK